MDLYDIEIFQTIRKTRSLSQTAELLNLAQSTVSHRLRMLEKELGTALFVRGKGMKTAELTDSGERFVPVAEKWMALREDCRHIKDRESAYPLSVGSTDSLNTFIFPELYRQLIHHTPPFILDIQTHHTYQIIDELLNRNLDVGLSVWNRPHPDIISEPVFSEEMQIVSNCDYHTKNIRSSDLNPADEIVFNWGEDYRIWHDRHFDPSVPAKGRADMVPLLLPLLEIENVWVCMPSACARYIHDVSGAHIYELEDAPPRRVCYKLTHRTPKHSRIHSIAVFEQMLSQYLQRGNHDDR